MDPTDYAEGMITKFYLKHGFVGSGYRSRRIIAHNWVRFPFHVFFFCFFFPEVLPSLLADVSSHCP